MRRKGEASRFKSTLIDPNAQEMNVYNDWNVARKDKGERDWSQAGRPPVGRPAPPCQVWPRASGMFSSVFLFLGIWVLWSRKGKKSMGEKRRDT